MSDEIVWDNYKKADVEQKLILLEGLLRPVNAELHRLSVTADDRAERLNQIGMRLDTIGNRLDMLEHNMNTLMLSHNTAEHDKRQSAAERTWIMVSLAGIASLALGSVGLSITTLITILNHVTVK